MALSSNKQWQNIQFIWEDNKNKPRQKALANFLLKTGWLMIVLLHTSTISKYSVTATVQYAISKVQPWIKTLPLYTHNLDCTYQDNKDLLTCIGMSED